MSRSTFAVLVVACLTLGSSPARAQMPQLLNYQGVLTDALGAPLADGDYDITFKLYSAATGGSALWSETHLATPLVRGGFSVLLGTTTALTLAFDSPYWLGVTVAPDPEMTPRVQLTATPYAFRAGGLILPFAATLNSASPGLKVGNNGAGASIVADGRLEVGSNAHVGDWALMRTGLTTDMVHGGSHPRGGYVDWLDEAGNVTATLDADGDGTGGLLQILRDPTNVGFQVDGNVNGTSEPTVTIQGSARSAIFRMGNSGNSSVALPTDAIGAAEILDEPGVASQSKATMAAPVGLLTVTSRSITVPTDGWVLAVGSVNARITRNSGGGSTDITFGLSTSSSSITTPYRLLLDSAMSLGFYQWPISLHALFEVNAGTSTVYLLASTANGVVDLDNARVTLIFLPTAYGTVTPSMLAGDGATDTRGVASRERP